MIDSKFWNQEAIHWKELCHWRVLRKSQRRPIKEFCWKWRAGESEIKMLHSWVMEASMRCWLETEVSIYVYVMGMYVCLCTSTHRQSWKYRIKILSKIKIREQDVEETKIKSYAYMWTSLFASTHNSTVGSRCPCHTSLPQSRQSTLRWLSLKRYIHRVMLELDRAWVLALSPLTLLPPIICFSFSTVFSCTRWTDRLVDRHLHCRINPEFYNSQNKFGFCWIL